MLKFNVMSLFSYVIFCNNLFPNIQFKDHGNKKVLFKNLVLNSNIILELEKQKEFLDTILVITIETSEISSDLLNFLDTLSNLKEVIFKYCKFNDQIIERINKSKYKNRIIAKNVNSKIANSKTFNIVSNLLKHKTLHFKAITHSNKKNIDIETKGTLNTVFNGNKRKITLLIKGVGRLYIDHKKAQEALEKIPIWRDVNIPKELLNFLTLEHYTQDALKSISTSLNIEDNKLIFQYNKKSEDIQFTLEFHIKNNLVDTIKIITKNDIIVISNITNE